MTLFTNNPFEKMMISLPYQVTQYQFFEPLRLEP